MIAMRRTQVIHFCIQNVFTALKNVLTVMNQENALLVPEAIILIKQQVLARDAWSQGVKIAMKIEKCA